MIKHVLITGDCHGKIDARLAQIKDTMSEYDPSETAIIILGDVGFNYYKNKKDWKLKHYAAQFGYTLYCLRGNHEDRANNTKGTKIVYDEFVHGHIFKEVEFPNIKYFADEVAEYNIMDKKILCIPGAYSVDKWYRLQNDWQWFSEEQLSEEEMKYAEERFGGEHYDIILSHTCPIGWEPRDLFLNCIDQSKVDKTMEIWMEKFKDMIGWGIWCFAHYHTDRIERPYVEQFYTKVEDMEDVWNRWQKYTETKELDWWLSKSPNFYMGE